MKVKAHELRGKNKNELQAQVRTDQRGSVQSWTSYVALTLPSSLSSAAEGAEERACSSSCGQGYRWCPQQAVKDVSLSDLPG